MVENPKLQTDNCQEQTKNEVVLDLASIDKHRILRQGSEGAARMRLRGW